MRLPIIALLLTLCLCGQGIAAPRLGERFESRAAGLSFQGPEGAARLQRASPDELVQYVDESGAVSLRVVRVELERPLPLSRRDGPDGAPQAGLLDVTAEQIRLDHADAVLHRQDTTNIASADVGMLVATYRVGAAGVLDQRAILRRSDQSYVLFAMVSPAPVAGSLDADPQVREAVDLFAAVLDSVRLLDQNALRAEQDERLFRTRNLYANLSETRLRDLLVREQFLRLLKDGKDVGYSYVVEETGSGVPSRDEAPNATPTGIRVGVRSHTTPSAGVAVDAESWSFVTFDRAMEVWSNLAVTRGGAQREVATEAGISRRRNRAIVDAGAAPDDANRGMALAEEYRLEVNQSGGSAQSEPIRRDLPPFYLPQALGQMLPRLVYREPQTYLFAAFVAERREVMTRYVDVGRLAEARLGDRTVEAIEVRDRVGLEGSVTVHYVAADGAYLGSVNEDSGITILATDAATLKGIWPDANLTRPAAVATNR